MQNSGNIKRYRARLKDRIVVSMGGECVICGYSKCNSALALHHKDPCKKDFSISSKIATPTKWETLVAELRKCVLLCHNCHSELHAGIVDLPLDHKVFDESFENYREVNKITYLCTCGAVRKKTAKTCGSQLCMDAVKFKVDWSSIDLDKMSATMSDVAIAANLGVSPQAVSKRRKRIRKLALEAKNT